LFEGEGAPDEKRANWKISRIRNMIYVVFFNDNYSMLLMLMKLS
jgi:hypothetical protein